MCVTGRVTIGSARGGLASLSQPSHLDRKRRRQLHKTPTTSDELNINEKTPTDRLPCSISAQQSCGNIPGEVQCVSIRRNQCAGNTGATTTYVASAAGMRTRVLKSRMIYGRLSGQARIILSFCWLPVRISSRQTRALIRSATRRASVLIRIPLDKRARSLSAAL